VGGDHQRIGGDDGAARRLDMDALAAFEIRGTRMRVNAPAAPLNGLRELSEILQRMELRLPGKAQRRAEVVKIERRTFDAHYIVQTRAMTSLQLLFEFIRRAAGRDDEVAVAAFE